MTIPNELLEIILEPLVVVESDLLLSVLQEQGVRQPPLLLDLIQWILLLPMAPLQFLKILVLVFI